MPASLRCIVRIISNVLCYGNALPLPASPAGGGGVSGEE